MRLVVRVLAASAVVLLAAVLLTAGAAPGGGDTRLRNASREPVRGGWITVRVAGTPGEIGFQHGYLLAPEIEDNFRAIRLGMTHESKDWNFYRTAAETVIWPRIEGEYRAELQGLVEGLKARGSKLDIQDVTAMNAFLELSPYYTNWYDKARGRNRAPKGIPERCSAFAATGSYTADGKVVIGHNNWSDYLTGARWNVIFDIRPSRGHRILMDGMPGLIHSGDDFGLNSAGMIITETTISQFTGDFDPQGIPEFVRARKAMQYAASIDEFAHIMREGNNGGYANNWLIADLKNNEIASLELGLRNVNLRRTADGYFAGANFPVDSKLIAEETSFNPNDPGVSGNARRARWERLMAEHKGRIDVASGQKFLADHVDPLDGSVNPSERTLCGHIDRSPRGLKLWQPEYGPAGVAQSKITNASMAARMSMSAAFGHSCGLPFDAESHLRAHPEFAWMKPLLKNMPAEPWTGFTAIR